MTILEAFEIVKSTVSDIRKKKQVAKVKNGGCLMINVDIHPNVDVIIYYNDVIKKMCKLDEIIYMSKKDGFFWEINCDEERIIVLNEKK